MAEASTHMLSQVKTMTQLPRVAAQVGNYSLRSFIHYVAEGSGIYSELFLA